MTIATALLAFAAYFVFTLAWAMLWNVVLFRRAYHGLVGAAFREDPIIPLGMLAIAFQAGAMIVLFALFFTGTDPVWEGVRLGLLTGVFVTAYGALVAPAKFQVARVGPYVVLELVYGLVHAVTVGLLMAWVFGWGAG